MPTKIELKFHTKNNSLDIQRVVKQLNK